MTNNSARPTREELQDLRAMLSAKRRGDGVNCTFSVAKVDVLLAEIDALTAERDAAVAERDAMSDVVEAAKVLKALTTSSGKISDVIGPAIESENELYAALDRYAAKGEG